ncbi:hypothetical protein [Auraticoccus monumenti]|uniref:Carbohydrate binding domain-containing protein n=1 Tax=Auraticoccus monumenti TaxID=675864 RepID=A0A1G6UH11_9ACTN|nr:hypothetical protein [Auraticoccus monumenti]SDD40539.1 hypothetical protein SAMN04489747_0882 [Auraticoccus monumenti]
MIDVASMDDSELEQTRRDLVAEQERRRQRAEMLEQEQRLAAEQLAKLDRQPGDEWQPPTTLTAYRRGDAVTHDGVLWRSLVDGNVWAPGVGGWRQLGGEDGTPAPWRQPSGAIDSYRIGEQVIWQGQVYRSLIDANVWSPEGHPHGWELVDQQGTEPSEEPPASEPATPTVAVWKQPAGGHDAYQKGDRVTHADKLWESTAEANVWAPGVYGWVAL